VDRRVARLFAARARMEAVALNKAGDVRRAQQTLGRVASRIRDYADGDDELTGLAAELATQASGEFAAPMSAPRLKEVHSLASYERRARNPDGQALRKP
jgi:hypothetical protein